MIPEFKDIKIIREFVEDGVVYGIYCALLNDTIHVFVANGKSFGAIVHYLNEPVYKCLAEMTEESKEIFFKELEKIKNIKETNNDK